ncbi:MAG: hypothetical protein ACXWXQ_10325 [Actinomycetota bacterium]
MTDVPSEEEVDREEEDGGEEVAGEAEDGGEEVAGEAEDDGEAQDGGEEVAGEAEDGGEEAEHCEEAVVADLTLFGRGASSPPFRVPRTGAC